MFCTLWKQMRKEETKIDEKKKGKATKQISYE